MGSRVKVAVEIYGCYVYTVDPRRGRVKLNFIWIGIDLVSRKTQYHTQTESNSAEFKLINGPFLISNHFHWRIENKGTV